MKQKKRMMARKLGKVLVGVLSCCMLLSGCRETGNSQTSFSFEEESESMESSQMIKEDKIYVYLCGAVINPGVYEVAEGSRLFEVIELAGGMTKDADSASQNLARVVQDGEQITIWTLEEAAELAKKAAIQKAGLVNINTAGVEELTTITGIGESRALAIIEYREQYGLFESIEGIKKVSGIKDGLFEKIKNQITV